MALVAIAKYPNETANPNLLTRASFQELIDLEANVLNETYVEENFGLCKPDPNRKWGRPSKSKGTGKPKCPPKKKADSSQSSRKSRVLNDEDSDQSDNSESEGGDHRNLQGK